MSRMNAVRSESPFGAGKVTSGGFGFRFAHRLAAVSLVAWGMSLGASAGADNQTGGLINRSAVRIPVEYVLEPDDEITIRSLQAKEIADKTFRIDQVGEVNFPLLGRVSLAGGTAHQAEAVLRERLKKFYIEPDVALDVSTRHSEPVSVIGAVGTPGVQQLRGQVFLLDALSLAGGIRGDAGPILKVTRQRVYGAIQHPSAHQAGPDTSVAEINLKSLLDVRDPADNIAIKPHDVISVPPAEIVYVVGNVKRSGGFALGGKTDISVLQAVALAEGLDARADPKHARILRRGQGVEAERKEIAVDVQRILAGKAEDVVLRPNDILFIPNSATKSIAARTIEAVLQVGTGLAIFRL